jgi:hypothetical protein
MTSGTAAGSPGQSASVDSGVRRLGVYAGLVALSASVGAIGLASGSLAMGATVNERLPLQSPVLGGIALVVVVGLPATVLALRAWQRRSGADRVAVAVGVLLIGWIAVEFAFIREFSFLQVLFVGVGISFVAIGVRAGLQPRS